MNKLVAVVVIARTASTRLPNKAVYDLGGKPAFVHAIERIADVVEIERPFVACTQNAQDDAIELLAKHYGIECFRGPEDPQLRIRMCFDKIGMKDGDNYMTTTCDVPLGIADWIPFAMEQMIKYDCVHFKPVIPEGTLAWAFRHIGNLGHWGEWVWAHYHKGLDHCIKIDVSAYQPEDYRMPGPTRRLLLLNLAPEYTRPWPWGLMALDHDAQAGVLKEIYSRLYKGKPIDVLDVYELLAGDPRLAEIIPIDSPQSAGPLIDKLEPYIRSIRLNADYVEVYHKGGKGDVTRSEAESVKPL